MRKRSVFVLVGLAATIATSARAEVDLTQKNAARREIRSKLANAPQGGSLQSLVDNSGLEWFLITDQTGAAVSSLASGAASEANYTGAVAASTTGGGTVNTTLTDAFDGYNVLVVDTGAGPTRFNANGPASTTCFGTTSQTNRELLYDAQQVGNVSVRRRVFVPENDAFARWVNVFTNVGSSVENVTVSTASNLGSDGGTVITSSSDGDATAEIGDTWVSSRQANAVPGDNDPRLGHVVQGASAPTPVAAMFFTSGNDSPQWGYNVVLQPGETVSIANFATGQPSNAAAQAKAASLATFPASANTATCLSPNEVAEVANFVTPATTEFVNNGSFELGGSQFHPTGWDPNEIGDSTDDGTFCEPDGTAVNPAVGGTNAVDGACYFRIRGEGFSANRVEEGHKYIRQVNAGGGDSGSYTLSGWAKSVNASFANKKKFEVLATFKGGGAKVKKRISFTRGTHDWELKTNTFNVNHDWSKLIVQVNFLGQGPQGNNQSSAGVAYFDGVSVVAN